jgi:hypothetical protein
MLIPHLFLSIIKTASTLSNSAIIEHGRKNYPAFILIDGLFFRGPIPDLGLFIPKHRQLKSGKRYDTQQ